MNNIILFCQDGYSHLLKSELESYGENRFIEIASNYIVLECIDYYHLKDLTFCHNFIVDYITFNSESVNSIARFIFEFYGEKIKERQIEDKWQLLFFQGRDILGLGKRVNSVKKSFLEICSKRTSRLSKLISSTWETDTFYDFGLFVFFKDYDTIYLSDKCYMGHQKRMADDPLAPSRSYLKVEEAYNLLKYQPQQDDVVVDLGAAPGGWSYSAAKRGARVFAIDNGKLKGGAKDNPLIIHKKEDAFKYSPENNKRVDWLFCDMVEEPKNVMTTLEKWFSNKWCRYFIFNLKFGWVDPVLLTTKLKSPDSFLSRYTKDYKISHLFHDHEEITVVGEL